MIFCLLSTLNHSLCNTTTFLLQMTMQQSWGDYLSSKYGCFLKLVIGKNKEAWPLLAWSKHSFNILAQTIFSSTYSHAETSENNQVLTIVFVLKFTWMIKTSLLLLRCDEGGSRDQLIWSLELQVSYLSSTLGSLIIQKPKGWGRSKAYRGSILSLWGTLHRSC